MLPDTSDIPSQRHQSGILRRNAGHRLNDPQSVHLLDLFRLRVRRVPLGSNPSVSPES